MKKESILVSACLLNIPCQYNGRPAKIQLDKEDYIDIFPGILIPVCPEQLSGLSTPRSQYEIQGGDGNDVLNGKAKVISKEGKDFTERFIHGAKIVYDIAKITHATIMITQQRSPSCSSKYIYDGNFNHKLKPGLGVCAALLQSKGIKLIDITTLKSSDE